MSAIPEHSPYQAGDWVRVHGYSGNPRGPRRWGWRGYVVDSLGDTILRGITDDGRQWAEYWGALGPDRPSEGFAYCTCCPKRPRTPSQLDLFPGLVATY
jgi:hypothetical protein